MKRRFFGVLLVLVALAFSGTSSAGQGADLKDLRMVAVGDNIATLFMITGGGKHTLAFGAEDERITIIDPKGPGTGEEIASKVKNGVDGTVVAIINTNAHRAGSNDEYPAVTEIISQANAKKTMAAMDQFKGARAKFLPTRTFTDRLSLTVKTVGEEEGTNRIDLYHFGPAYTDGDAIIVFPSLNTVFMGDVFQGQHIPLIDRRNGGSAVSLPDTVDKAVAMLKGVKGLKIVMPGRQAPPPGPYVPTWLWPRVLDEYADFTKALLSAVKGAIAEGKSVDQAAATLTLPEPFKSYGTEHKLQYVQAVYDELKK